MLLKPYFFSACWAALILILTLIPGKNLPEVSVVGIDKVAHLAFYGILMFLTLRDHRIQLASAVSPAAAFRIFILCFAYGFMIEGIQHFVPGRSFSIYDQIANTLGAALGYVLFKLILKK